jgi:hypothetical protein
MTTDQIIEQPTRIKTTTVPTVTRWGTDETPVYLLEFEDAGVSVRLTEAQVRGLGANILWSTMTSDDDLEAMSVADDDPA